MTDWTAARQTYLDHLGAPDVRAGALMIEELVGRGTSIAAIVQEVLRPAQIEVGRRWQSNEWTVAHEHAASAVTEAALMAAALHSTPESSAADSGGVVLACASGEWHTLPLRMVSVVLAAAGFHCVFLGPSVPPGHLRDYLEAVRPLALALNCSYGLSLEGAGESIDAAHSVGVPVLVGGRGFGADGHRASMLRADAWTDDPEGAIDILTSWAATPPTTLCAPGPFHREPPLDEQELMTVRDDVVAALRRELPMLDGYTAVQWMRTHEDIDYIVRFAVLAIRLDDERLFSEFAAWLREVLTARRVPPAVFSRSLLATADALQARRPEVGSCVRRAAGDVVPADPRTV